MKVLEDAGVQVPPNTADLVRASLAAAFVAVRLDDDEEEENNDNSAPDNEQLFNEIMQILDETEDDDQQAGPSS